MAKRRSTPEANPAGGKARLPDDEPDPDMASEVFRLGASAYLLKTSAGSELIRALREVLLGGTYVTPLMTTKCGSFVQNLRVVKTRNNLPCGKEKSCN
jgi:DNA-binding NarL/FixJ family response regulator